MTGEVAADFLRVPPQPRHRVLKTSVTAGLDYLVTNDTESGSSKNRKAKQYGTQIINEDEFLMMVG